MEKAAEQTLDRSFDQTAEHVHLNGEPCPTCKSFECIGATPAGVKDADAGPPYCEHCGVSMGNVPFRFHNFCSHTCRKAGLKIAGINAAGPDDFGGEDFPTDRQPRAIGNTFPEHLRRPFDRHVSPAILEQRILDLEAERDSLRSDCELELSRRTEAEKRIKHFENLVSVLSSYIDKLTVTVAQVQRTAKFVTDFAGQMKGGQPLPFAVPADDDDNPYILIRDELRRTEEARKRA